eukprot:766889-Hanusia_phi.AAC.1
MNVREEVRRATMAIREKGTGEAEGTRGSARPSYAETLGGRSGNGETLRSREGVRLTSDSIWEELQRLKTSTKFEEVEVRVRDAASIMREPVQPSYRQKYSEIETQMKGADYTSSVLDAIEGNVPTALKYNSIQDELNKIDLDNIKEQNRKLIEDLNRALHRSAPEARNSTAVSEFEPKFRVMQSQPVANTESNEIIRLTLTVSGLDAESFMRSSVHEFAQGVAKSLSLPIHAIFVSSVDPDVEAGFKVRLNIFFSKEGNPRDVFGAIRKMCHEKPPYLALEREIQALIPSLIIQGLQAELLRENSAYPLSEIFASRYSSLNGAQTHPMLSETDRSKKLLQDYKESLSNLTHFEVTQSNSRDELLNFIGHWAKQESRRQVKEDIRLCKSLKCVTSLLGNRRAILSLEHVLALSFLHRQKLAAYLEEPEEKNFSRGSLRDLPPGEATDEDLLFYQEQQERRRAAYAFKAAEPKKPKARDPLPPGRPWDLLADCNGLTNLAGPGRTPKNVSWARDEAVKDVGTILEEVIRHPQERKREVEPSREEQEADEDAAVMRRLPGHEGSAGILHPHPLLHRSKAPPALHLHAGDDGSFRKRSPAPQGEVTSPPASPHVPLSNPVRIECKQLGIDLIRSADGRLVVLDIADVSRTKDLKMGEEVALLPRKILEAASTRELKEAISSYVLLETLEATYESRIPSLIFHVLREEEQRTSSSFTFTSSPPSSSSSFPLVRLVVDLPNAKNRDLGIHIRRGKFSAAVISSCDSTSPAAAAGLRVGDVIVGLGQRKCKELSEEDVFHYFKVTPLLLPTFSSSCTCLALFITFASSSFHTTSSSPLLSAFFPSSPSSSCSLLIPLSFWILPSSFPRPCFPSVLPSSSSLSSSPLPSSILFSPRCRTVSRASSCSGPGGTGPSTGSSSLTSHLPVPLLPSCREPSPPPHCALTTLSTRFQGPCQLLELPLPSVPRPLAASLPPPPPSPHSWAAGTGAGGARREGSKERGDGGRRGRAGAAAAQQRAGDEHQMDQGGGAGVQERLAAGRQTAGGQSAGGGRGGGSESSILQPVVMEEEEGGEGEGRGGGGREGEDERQGRGQAENTSKIPRLALLGPKAADPALALAPAPALFSSSVLSGSSSKAYEIGLLRTYALPVLLLLLLDSSSSSKERGGEGRGEGEEGISSTSFSSSKPPAEDPNFVLPSRVEGVQLKSSNLQLDSTLLLSLA